LTTKFFNLLISVIDFVSGNKRNIFILDVIRSKVNDLVKNNFMFNQRRIAKNVFLCLFVNFRTLLLKELIYLLNNIFFHFSQFCIVFFVKGSFDVFILIAFRKKHLISFFIAFIKSLVEFIFLRF